ncbi:MAG: alpha/beta hydrolase, partial [Fimbriimonas ginsengisoli]|nr:alpha/beta hydrolase [Fimbriimonas ginsengisoli]
MLQVDSVYAQPGGVPLQYDLVRPRTDEAVPLIVCIHGGGWISG